MSTAENKALIRRFLEEVLNTGNVDAADHLLAPDFTIRMPGMPPISGLESFKQLAAGYFQAFPDLQETHEEVIAEDDTVVCLVTWRGGCRAT